MSQHPTWFGPAERPLFGWLHVPEGGLARGAVVCCPPLGVEAVAAHRALRELALSLEAAGYAVLRFDYAGTGDSAGAGLGVADWVQSIRVAVEYVRDCGLSRVGLVGMRLGATLAAEVAGTVDAAVFWDPCSSGRAFIREHQLLREASVGGQVLPRTDAADGSVEILGSVFSAPVVAGLRGLDFGRSVRAAAAARTLVLTRPEQAIPEPWRQALPSAQWGLARGQGELLDVTADLAQLPTATAGLIRWWLERTLDGPLETVTPLLRRSAELTLEGRVVVEELVEVGPTGLFGVLARPAQGEPAGSVLVFTNAGLIDHTGPARLWVERGRSYASVGIPTLRLDLSGLGDSPTHPAQRRDIPHPYEALQDLADTAESLPQLLGAPADLVLAGLCSGAYHAIEGALAGHAQGVIALNPLLGFEPPRPNTEVRLEAAVPLRPWADRLRRIDALARFAEYRLPPLIWWLLDVLRIQRHQAHGLQQLAERAVPTLVLCGDAEARPFLRRAKGVMRRLRRGGIVQFELLPSIDHTLYGAEARQRTVARLDAYVLSRYAAPPDSSALSYRTIVDASDERPGRLPRPRAAAVAELPVSSRFALVALIGLFGLAQQYLGQLLGEAGALGAAQALFVVGLVLIFVPSVWRMLGRGVPRRERLGIALLLTMLLAASNLLLGARPFTGFDEVEHQVTLWQLGHGHTLSGVGAHAGHPGVELAALAGHWLAGVPVGVSAVVATVAGRLLLVLMVFLLVERALGSSRAASIAVVACLATPQFYAFNAPHTVATIGLTFAVGVIYLTARAAATPGLRWGLIALSAAALAGLVLCSALVSVVTVGGLVLVAAALLVLRRAAARAVGAVALLGMALLGGWTALVVTHLQPGTPDSLRQRISTQLFGAAVPAAFRGPADRSAPGWQQLAVPGAALAVVVLLLVNRRLRARVRPVALLLLAVAAFGVTTVVSVGPDWSFTPGHQPAATAARAVDPGGI
ncbi:alpha/beta hydrolase family protein, partial [Jatrophihabitans sp.]|uniref:alpha/beta hydrolase family protein n=1 Tax=Jatrophihabitans sp. TaxID=1932789 RepID=UPI0030C66C1A|nr:hypothetical protein [Jatrophihabitans sp.]